MGIHLETRGVDRGRFDETGAAGGLESLRGTHQHETPFRNAADYRDSQGTKLLLDGFDPARLECRFADLDQEHVAPGAGAEILTSPEPCRKKVQTRRILQIHEAGGRVEETLAPFERRHRPLERLAQRVQSQRAIVQPGDVAAEVAQRVGIDVPPVDDL